MTDPVTSIRDDGRYLEIVVHLPGIPEERIKVDLEKNTLVISASFDDTTFHKEIAVPLGVRLYKKRLLLENLEITLELPAR